LPLAPDILDQDQETTPATTDHMGLGLETTAETTATVVQDPFTRAPTNLDLDQVQVVTIPVVHGTHTILEATLPTVDMGLEVTLPTVDMGLEVTLPTVDMGLEVTLPTVDMGLEVTLPTVDMGLEVTLPTVDMGLEATLPTVDMGLEVTIQVVVATTRLDPGTPTLLDLDPTIQATVVLALLVSALDLDPSLALEPQLGVNAPIRGRRARKARRARGVTKEKERLQVDKKSQLNSEPIRRPKIDNFLHFVILN